MVDGALWVATTDDGYPTKCGIYKLDAENGNILSYFKTEPIKGDVAYFDHKLYAMDTQGVLYCLDTKTDRLLWTAKPSEIRGYYSRSNVLLAEDKVIIGRGLSTHTLLCAYDKETGELVWEKAIKAVPSPSRFLFDSQRRQIILCAHWRFIYAISIDTGEIIWSNNEPDLCWFNTATPTIEEDKIYKRGRGKIGILDAKTGEIINSIQTNFLFDVSGQGVVDQDLIYFPTANAGVLAYDKNTFEHKITFPAYNTLLLTSPYNWGEIQTVETNPIIYNDKLIFGASDGFVHIYDKKTATPIRKINVGSPILATPIIKDGKIYTADFFGNIKMFKL